jgi:radical SAM protein with 4Fe4S-binding SPASM domain
MGAPWHKYKDLDTQTCYGIIGQMAEANVSGISFSGGEPLTRGDFWQLVDACGREGILVQKLYTNGVLMDEDFFRNLEARKSDLKFIISFDGVGHHDWMRGVPGAEQKAIAAIKKAKERGFYVHITTTLYSGSISSVLPTYELFKKLGVDYWRVNMCFDLGDWQTKKNAEVPLDFLYEKYLELIVRYKKDGQPLGLNVEAILGGKKGGGLEILLERQRLDEKGLEGYSCDHLRFRPYLLPDGRLIPCAAMTGSVIEKDMPSLLDVPLAEIYGNPECGFRKVACVKAKDVVEHNEECRQCTSRFACGGGCRAFGIYSTNDVLGRAGLHCRFYREGYRDKLRELVGV